MLVLAGVFAVLIILFGLSVFRQRQVSAVNRKSLVIGVLGFGLACGGTYFSLVHDADQLQWLAEQETMLVDVKDLLDTGEASDKIKALEPMAFIGLLGYYSRAYPSDARIWQKLAVVMLSTGAPDQALKAVRRFLQVSPMDLQGQKLEVQLLLELLSGEERVSPRQLKYALQRLLEHPDLEIEDRFYIASLAQQQEFSQLAVDVWQSLLDQDQRPDSALSPKALEGRKVVQMLLERSQEALYGTFEMQIQADIQADIPSSEDGYHLWVSLRHQGPPIAALLLPLESDHDFSKSIAISLGDKDLVTRGIQAGTATLKVRLLTGQSSDPLAPQQDIAQGQEIIDLEQYDGGTINLIIK